MSLCGATVVDTGSVFADVISEVLATVTVLGSEVTVVDVGFCLLLSASEDNVTPT